MLTAFPMAQLLCSMKTEHCCRRGVMKKAVNTVIGNSILEKDSFSIQAVMKKVSVKAIGISTTEKETRSPGNIKTPS